MSENKSGIVYVFSNPAMPGIVKIGITNREKVDDRLRELFTTSVPVPFECEYACKVDNYESVETALHIAFNPNRINPQREFFKIDPDQAIAILRLLSKNDITPEITKEIKAGMNPIDVEAGKKLKIQRRPPINFFEMGIKVGDRLIFAHDEITAEVIVKSEKKVDYNGLETSLTAATKAILNLDYSIQPTRFWSYNGKGLDEIYEQTYTSNEND